MKYLMWDIDGTLLLTGGAGMLALERAVKAYFGLESYKFRRSFFGRTDLDIIKDIVEEVRGRWLPGEGAALLRRYIGLLPQALPECKGRVLPFMKETLDFVARHTKWRNCLLTGNIEAAAALKLQYYGLWSYFAGEKNFYGDISPRREEVAKKAWQALYEADPFLTPDDVLVIGDTPNDALCARAIGARCLILLHGSGYEEKAFDAIRPWRIMETLPPAPQDFVRLIEEEDDH